MSFKKRTVVMLPTNEKAIDKLMLYEKTHNWRGDIIWNTQLEVSINPVYIRNTLLINQGKAATNSQSKCDLFHFYILSDEEIKEGDWYIQESQIFQYKGYYSINQLPKFNYTKKIIASTDPSLKLPQPFQAFIEKYIKAYNKGDKIEDVMVEYDEEWINSNPKYDTLKISKDNIITIKEVKDSWSRKEIERLLEKAYDAGYDSGYENSPIAPDEKDRENPTFDEWIKDNI